MNTLSCPECKKEIQNENPVVLKRMLARHRSVTHGVPGTSAAAVYRNKHKTEAAALALATPAGGPATNAARPSDHPRYKERRTYYERNRTKILAQQRASRNLLKLARANPKVHFTKEAEANMKSSAWWQVENQQGGPRSITCPCCGSVFAIIERKGQ